DLLIWCAVLNPECPPRQAHRKDRERCKEAATHNEVLRRVQLEEQGLAWVQGTKLPPPSRLPEVHLGKPGLLAEEVEPLVVGDRDKRLHGHRPRWEQDFA